MAEKKKRIKLEDVFNKVMEHDKRFDNLEMKFDKKVVNIFDKLKEHDKRFDDVTITLDKIVGELEKAREDRVFAKAKDKEQDQRLESLEGRVGR